MALDGVVPFPPDFVARYRAKGYWEDRSLAGVFQDVFATFAGRTALIAGSEHITYRELAGRVERLARHFLELGLRPLDRVVVQLPNVPEFVSVYFALQRVGAIPVMALPPHRYREIKYYVELTEAVAYVIPDRAGDFDFVELARRITSECRSLRHVVVAGEAPPGMVSLATCLSTESRVPASVLGDVTIDSMDPAVRNLSIGMRQSVIEFSE